MAGNVKEIWIGGAGSPPAGRGFDHRIEAETIDQIVEELVLKITDWQPDIVLIKTMRSQNVLRKIVSKFVSYYPIKVWAMVSPRVSKGIKSAALKF
ncbi:MAG: hypothetical protein ACRCYY_03955 [Trueperaceae bacterium]